MDFENFEQGRLEVETYVNYLSGLEFEERCERDLLEQFDQAVHLQHVQTSSQNNASSHLGLLDSAPAFCDSILPHIIAASEFQSMLQRLVSSCDSAATASSV